MSLYLRGKVWWSRIEIKGIAHQFSTKETNKTKAGWIESRKRDELVAGIGVSPTLKDFSERFLKSLPARVSKETKRFYVAHLQALLSFPPLAECRLDRIHPAVIEEFVQHRRTGRQEKGNTGALAVATINHNLRTLRRILHLAEEWEVIHRAPKIKLLSGENQREYVLSDETITRFEKRGTTMGRLVPFLCDTGLRRGEACALTWAAVHLDAVPPSIEVLKGKTKAARRRIPLTARAARILTEIQEMQRLDTETEYVHVFTSEGRTVGATWMSHTFRSVARNLELPGTCVLHSTRHTFCSRLGEAGADAFSIQRLAGHSSIVISQRYVHASGPRLDAAMGLLEPTPTP
jgi:integrase